MVSSAPDRRWKREAEKGGIGSAGSDAATWLCVSEASSERESQSAREREGVIDIASDGHVDVRIRALSTPLSTPALRWQSTSLHVHCRPCLSGWHIPCAVCCQSRSFPLLAALFCCMHAPNSCARSPSKTRNTGSKYLPSSPTLSCLRLNLLLQFLEAWLTLAYIVS